MGTAERLLKACGRILLSALALVVALSATAVARVGYSKASSRDWPAADRARLRDDLRLAARRVSESASRQRRDLARLRQEARHRAAEMKREAQRLAWEKRQQAARMKAEMSAAMRAYKQSLRSQSWRNRNRI